MSLNLLMDVLRSHPFKPLRKSVRTLQDYFHYYPRPWFQAREFVKGSYTSKAVTERLQTDGICILEKFLDEETVNIYRDELDALFRSRLVRHDDPSADNCRINFVQHRLYANLILEGFILAAVEAYYSKPLYLVTSQAQRLYPVEPYEASSYQWHHDSKGKYVKAMWLLTDVSATGQRMSYVVGSHRYKHSFATYEETRFTDAHARSLGRVIECAGPAGSVVIFDANGVHRGNRNLGPIRDVVIGTYSAGRYLHGAQFDLNTLESLDGWQRGILRRSQFPSKGYETDG